MIELDGATVLLQWAAGGWLFLWVTTRRREVGLGYGWLQRLTFLGLGALSLAAAFLTSPTWEREIMTIARGIAEICDRHGVPVAAAALQFPLHHPAVATVIPGANSPEQVRANVAAMRHNIPDDLWAEMKDDGLLRANAPTPG